MVDMTNGELSRWLNRVEAKLDTVTSDHEQRLRKIERVLYAASGLAATGTLSGLGAIVAQAFGA